jgi:hypothetical protein
MPTISTGSMEKIITGFKSISVKPGKTASMSPNTILREKQTSKE